MSEFDSALSHQRYCQAAILVRRAGQTFGPDFWTNEAVHAKTVHEEWEDFDGSNLMTMFRAQKDQIAKHEPSAALYQTTAGSSIIVPPESSAGYSEEQREQVRRVLLARNPQASPAIDKSLAGGTVCLGKIGRYRIDDQICVYTEEVVCGVGNLDTAILVAERRALWNEGFAWIGPEDLEEPRQAYTDDLWLGVAPGQALDWLQGMAALPKAPVAELLTLTDLERLCHILSRLQLLGD